MESLYGAPDAAKRPLFRFDGTEDLSAEAALTTANQTGTNQPASDFALAGPSEKIDAAHLPVRGDLAHIRLAGKVFVPHYAVPMPRLIGPQRADLRKIGRADSEVMTTLDAGTLFNVLDMAGAYAWGQVGDDGLVGYVALADIA